MGALNFLSGTNLLQAGVQKKKNQTALKSKQNNRQQDQRSHLQKDYIVGNSPKPYNMVVSTTVAGPTKDQQLCGRSNRK